MKVTFLALARHNPATVFPESPGAANCTLTFTIDFRGKTYHCVGHFKQQTAESCDLSPVRFAGYYGYNGPINIEKLRSAAVDFWQSAQQDESKGSSQVQFQVGESPRLIAHQFTPGDLRERIGESEDVRQDYESLARAS